MSFLEKIKHNVAQARKEILVAAAATLLIIVVGLSYLTVGPGASETGTADNQDAATADVLDKTQYLRGTSQPEQAADVAQRGYTSAADTQDKYRLALETASIYETNKQYKKAVTWYLKAAEIQKDNRAVLSGLARSYDGLGNHDKAVTYYRKTIKVINPEEDGAEGDREYFRLLMERAKKADQQ